MYSIAPAVSSCVPDGHTLQARFTLDGRTGRIIKAELIEDQSNFSFEAPFVKCVERAVIGKPSPKFARDSFLVSYPFLGMRE